MTVKSWAWLLLAAAGFTVVAVLWATGPHDCQPPDTRGHVRCLR